MHIKLIKADKLYEIHDLASKEMNYMLKQGEIGDPAPRVWVYPLPERTQIWGIVLKIL